MTVRNCVYGIQSKLGVGSMQGGWCSGPCGTGCWTTMQRGVRGTGQAFVGRNGDQARRPTCTFTGAFVGLRMATAEGQGEVGA